MLTRSHSELVTAFVEGVICVAHGRDKPRGFRASIARLQDCDDLLPGTTADLIAKLDDGMPPATFGQASARLRRLGH